MRYVELWFKGFAIYPSQLQSLSTNRYKTWNRFSPLAAGWPPSNQVVSFEFMNVYEASTTRPQHYLYEPWSLLNRTPFGGFNFGPNFKHAAPSSSFTTWPGGGDMLVRVDCPILGNSQRHWAEHGSRDRWGHGWWDGLDVLVEVWVQKQSLELRFFCVCSTLNNIKPLVCWMTYGNQCFKTRRKLALLQGIRIYKEIQIHGEVSLKRNVQRLVANKKLLEMPSQRGQRAGAGAMTIDYYWGFYGEIWEDRRLGRISDSKAGTAVFIIQDEVGAACQYHINLRSWKENNLYRHIFKTVWDRWYYKLYIYIII